MARRYTRACQDHARAITNEVISWTTAEWLYLLAAIACLGVIALGLFGGVQGSRAKKAWESAHPGQKFPEDTYDIVWTYQTYDGKTFILIPVFIPKPHPTLDK